jgi:hypothetical protein
MRSRKYIYATASSMGCSNTDCSCRCVKRDEVTNLALDCVLSSVCDEDGVLSTIYGTNALANVYAAQTP